MCREQTPAIIELGSRLRGSGALRRVMLPLNAGTKNIGVAPSFLTRWLVPRVRQFQDRFPDLELHLSPNSGPIDFARSDIDMAIYFGGGDWPGVETLFLHQVVLVPVCGPGCLSDRGPIGDLQQLCRRTLIDVSTRPTEWDDLLAGFGMARPRQAKRLSFSNTSLAVGAAMEDLGVALADRQLIAREFATVGWCVRWRSR